MDILGKWNPELLTFKESLKAKVDSHGNAMVYDIVRKKWLIQGPEELVRQLVIHYLVAKHNIRLKSIQIEKKISKDSKLRLDAAVYTEGGEPYVLIECKSWEVDIKAETLNQISKYNQILQFPYCWVTNGRQNVLFRYNDIGACFEYFDSFPDEYV
jgi:hypothetical protein